MVFTFLIEKVQVFNALGLARSGTVSKQGHVCLY